MMLLQAAARPAARQQCQAQQLQYYYLVGCFVLWLPTPCVELLLDVYLYFSVTASSATCSRLWLVGDEQRMTPS
jgi:hypothetical protein